VLAIVSWQCSCGIKVKAMYETDSAIEVRCPNPLCQLIHKVDGKITEMWISEDSTGWRSHAFSHLVLE
jgi:hypothetical protein